jgi:membrane protein
VPGLSALGHWFPGMFAGKVLLAALNTVVSLAIFTLLFRSDLQGSPHTPIPWQELALAHLSQPYPSPSENR